MAKRKSKKNWKVYPTEEEFNSEDQLQAGCFKWFDQTFGSEFRCSLYHINNSPKHARDGNRLKALGMKAGTPDLFLSVPLFDLKYGGLYIEMKTDTGSLQPVQVKQMNVLTRFKNKCCVICSLAHFKEVVMHWISLYRKENDAKPHEVD